MKIAIIGGTGMGELFHKSKSLIIERKRVLRIPYGGPVYYTQVIDHSDTEIVTFIFIDRHNCSGSFQLPHQLNHQAYMYVLIKVLKVDIIIATSAVGGVVDRAQVGDILIPIDVVDYVQGAYTFARDDWNDPIAFHRPATNLFCPQIALKIFQDRTIYHSGDIILANSVKGPSFETSAEIEIRRRDGVSLVGMPTAFPEACLAGEGAVPYSVICGVSNPAPDNSGGSEVVQVMKELNDQFYSLILSTVRVFQLETEQHQDDCPCRKGRERSVFDILP